MTPRAPLRNPVAKAVWNFISLFGTLGAGLLVCAVGFYASLRLGWLMAADLLVITAASNTIKYFYFKPRPDNPEAFRPGIDFHVLDLRRYCNPLRPVENVRNVMRAFHYVDAGSFPSIHAARSLNQAVLAAAFFAGRPLLQAALIAAALLVGWSRVVKLRHFRTDVAVGFALGLATALLSLWLAPLW